MIRKLIVLPAAVLFFSTGQMFLSSCKDKQKQEETTTTSDTTVTAPAPPAPVEINSDDTLKTSVADATKDYPTVNAAVNDGVITLTGSIERSKLRDLMTNLNGLKPKKIENQLVIK